MPQTEEHTVDTTELPAEGLVVSPPDMARAIAAGEKTLLVKSKPVAIGDSEYVLLSLRKALGVVRLGEPRELDAEKFAKTEGAHLITEKRLEEWAEVQPSWGEGPWTAWPVVVVEKFDEPLETNAPVSPEIVISDLEVEKRMAPQPLPPNVSEALENISKLLPVKGDRKSVDIFCGMGALSLGFERAGFQPTLAVDMEKAAVHTYAANRPKVPVLHGDCSKFDTEELARKVGKVEAVCGGVPCEAFSTHSGVTSETRAADPRRELIRTAMKFVASFQPRMFIFENVIQAAKSPQWAKAREKLSQSGYGVALWKLKASDYGTPQKRKRAFLVGVRGADPDSLEPPESLGTEKGVGEAFKGLGNPTDDGAGDHLHVTPPPFDEKVRAALKSAKAGDRLVAHGYGGRNEVYLSNADTAANTVTSASTNGIHPNRKRWFTTREVARLQEIPDDYEIPVSRSKAQQLIGDAVPVGLAEAVAKRAYSFVSKSESDLDCAEVDAALSDVVDCLEGGPGDFPEDEVVEKVDDAETDEQDSAGATLEPGVDLEGFTDEELAGAHWDLHQMYVIETWKPGGMKGWSTEDIVNTHAQVVDELLERSEKEHPPPPDNGLDELSSDFERNAAKQPVYYERPVGKRGFTSVKEARGSEEELPANVLRSVAELAAFAKQRGADA